MIDPYFVIQHQSLEDTLKLLTAHGDMRDTKGTEPPSAAPSSETVPVPTSPTVPSKQRAA